MVVIIRKHVGNAIAIQLKQQKNLEKITDKRKILRGHKYDCFL